MPSIISRNVDFVMTVTAKRGSRTITSFDDPSHIFDSAGLPNFDTTTINAVDWVNGIVTISDQKMLPKIGPSGAIATAYATSDLNLKITSKKVPFELVSQTQIAQNTVISDNGSANEDVNNPVGTALVCGTLWMGSPPNQWRKTYRTFLKFDSDLEGDTIRLKYQNGWGPLDFDLAVYPVLADWGETTITWNNQPSLGAALDTQNSGASFVEFSVSANTQYGFCIKRPIETDESIWIHFRASSEGNSPILYQN